VVKAAKVAKRRSSPAKPAAKSRAKPAVRARLARYRAKRDFQVTAEPSGDAPARPATGASFVIQKHAARRLHYDFRLELDGVLLSWSVPKGPSLVAGDRRLAVRTEDHPLDYADFEGIIPAGEYGGGTVVVWDRGSWTPDGDPRDGMKRGRLTFDLAGQKLTGRWHLVRTKGDGGTAESWLLFKGKDAAAVAAGSIVDDRPESVISGRTVEEVAADRDRVWHSNRPASGKAAPPPELHALVGALPRDTPLTNLDKVLYPDQGLTKAQLIAYVAVTAEWSLPHLAGRPLTLVRCPNGAGTKCFFQKHAAESAPASIRRIPIAEDGGAGETEDYMVVDELKGLIATAQLGALELHTWGAHADDYEHADLLVFDLDPDPAVGWDAVVAAAIDVRDRLAAIELPAWVKTTGGKGLHVCVPIAPTLGWDDVKAFTRAFAEHVVAQAPARYTANPLKAKRKGKIFVDYLRNGRGATFIAPYSMRARAGAPVATPVTWDELEAGLDPASFTVLTVPQRLGELGVARDPWAAMASTPPKITAAMRKAVGIR
jgi:bifunctional non-homologous end joining protein LigD